MQANPEQLSQIKQKLVHHLEAIYGSVAIEQTFDDIAQQLISIMRLEEVCHEAVPQKNSWNETDVALITYGDSVLEQGKSSLSSLHDFLNTYIKDTINSVHILPFFRF